MAGTETRYGYANGGSPSDRWSLAGNDMNGEPVDGTSTPRNAGDDMDEEYILSPQEAEASRISNKLAAFRQSIERQSNTGTMAGSSNNGAIADGRLPPFAPTADALGQESTLPDSPGPEHNLLPGKRTGRSLSSDSTSLRKVSDSDSKMISWPLNPSGSVNEESALTPVNPDLSLGTVLQGRKSYELQKVEPFFTDPTGLYYSAFRSKLETLTGKTSEGPLCIEEYLVKSEKDWFDRFRNVKLGRSAATTPAGSLFRERMNSPDGSTVGSDDGANDDAGQFLLQDDYKPPRGLKKLLLQRLGNWPLYTFLLAFVSPPKSFHQDSTLAPRGRQRLQPKATTNRTFGFLHKMD